MSGVLRPAMHNTAPGAGGDLVGSPTLTDKTLRAGLTKGTMVGGRRRVITSLQYVVPFSFVSHKRFSGDPAAVCYACAGCEVTVHAWYLNL